MTIYSTKQLINIHEITELTAHYRPYSENIYQELFIEGVVVKSHKASYQKRDTKVNYYQKDTFYRKSRKLIVMSFYIVYNAS